MKRSRSIWWTKRRRQHRKLRKSISDLFKLNSAEKGSVYMRYAWNHTTPSLGGLRWSSWWPAGPTFSGSRRYDLTTSNDRAVLTRLHWHHLRHVDVFFDREYTTMNLILLGVSHDSSKCILLIPLTRTVYTTMGNSTTFELAHIYIVLCSPTYHVLTFRETESKFLERGFGSKVTLASAVDLLCKSSRLGPGYPAVAWGIDAGMIFTILTRAYRILHVAWTNPARRTPRCDLKL